MSIERIASDKDAFSLREWFDMTQRVKDHHLFLFGEDGRTGFAAEVQDFISRQKGAWASIQFALVVIGVAMAAIAAMVAYATFFRGH